MKNSGQFPLEFTHWPGLCAVLEAINVLSLEAPSQHVRRVRNPYTSLSTPLQNNLSMVAALRFAMKKYAQGNDNGANKDLK